MYTYTSSSNILNLLYTAHCFVLPSLSFTFIIGNSSCRGNGTAHCIYALLKLYSVPIISKKIRLEFYYDFISFNNHITYLLIKLAPFLSVIKQDKNLMLPCKAQDLFSRKQISYKQNKHFSFSYGKII